MIDTPQITQTAAQLTALIHLTVPPEEIRKLMEPGLSELKAVIARIPGTPYLILDLGEKEERVLIWCASRGLWFGDLLPHHSTDAAAGVAGAPGHQSFIDKYDVPGMHKLEKFVTPSEDKIIAGVKRIMG